MSYATSHPTPSFSHLTSSDYQNVYEPAEDSFLLMDALEKESKFLKSMRPLICVEIGSGSGAVVTFLATLLQTPSFYWATDLNYLACECTSRTLAHNGVAHCDCVCMDLMSCFHKRLVGKVDVLVFNPPYVVTPSDEVGSQGIEASWAGGRDGREVTDRLLPDLASLLSPAGVFYLVVLPDNKPGYSVSLALKVILNACLRVQLDFQYLVLVWESGNEVDVCCDCGTTITVSFTDDICDKLTAQGLKHNVVLNRRAQNEKLSVLKFKKIVV